MDLKKKARMSMLQELSKTMADDQYGGLKDKMAGKLDKVTVMANSPEGLKKGLSKAEEIIKKKTAMPEMDASDMEDEGEDKDHEDSESSDYEAGEDEAEAEMSKEDIMDAIAMLQEKLNKLK